MTRDELIERVNEACRKERTRFNSAPVVRPTMTDVSIVKAIFAEIDQAGFVIMPREPTEAMIEAARKYLFAGQSETNIWAAYGGMIEASQENLP